MIESIHIAKTATFGDAPQAMIGLKMFNYICGSNGSGKTTISRVIADRTGEIRIPNLRSAVAATGRSGHQPTQSAALAGQVGEPGDDDGVRRQVADLGSRAVNHGLDSRPRSLQGLIRWPRLPALVRRRSLRPNPRPALLAHLSATYGKPVAAEDLFAYIAAVAAHRPTSNASAPTWPRRACASR